MGCATLGAVSDRTRVVLLGLYGSAVILSLALGYGVDPFIGVWAVFLTSPLSLAVLLVVWKLKGIWGGPFVCMAIILLSGAFNAWVFASLAKEKKE